jgi:hypothetical protein
MLMSASDAAVDAAQAIIASRELIASALVVGGGYLAHTLIKYVFIPFMCVPGHLRDYNNDMAVCEGSVAAGSTMDIVFAVGLGLSLAQGNSVPENTSTSSASSSHDDDHKHNGPRAR